jgi:hypothetical protein
LSAGDAEVERRLAGLKMKRTPRTMIAAHAMSPTSRAARMHESASFRLVGRSP